MGDVMDVDVFHRNLMRFLRKKGVTGPYNTAQLDISLVRES